MTLGMWRRFGAACIDLGFCALVALTLFPLWVSQGVRLHWVVVLFLAIYLLYSTIFLALNGRTLGLALVGARVKSAVGPSLLMAQCVCRPITYWVGFFLAGAGWFSGIVREDKRFLHEIASLTETVRIQQP